MPMSLPVGGEAFALRLGAGARHRRDRNDEGPGGGSVRTPPMIGRAGAASGSCRNRHDGAGWPRGERDERSIIRHSIGRAAQYAALLRREQDRAVIWRDIHRCGTQLLDSLGRLDYRNAMLSVSQASTSHPSGSSSPGFFMARSKPETVEGAFDKPVAVALALFGQIDNVPGQQVAHGRRVAFDRKA